MLLANSHSAFGQRGRKIKIAVFQSIILTLTLVEAFHLPNQAMIQRRGVRAVSSASARLINKKENSRLLSAGNFVIRRDGVADQGVTFSPSSRGQLQSARRMPMARSLSLALFHSVAPAATSNTALFSALSPDIESQTAEATDAVFADASLIKVITSSRGGVAAILISDESIKTTGVSFKKQKTPSSLSEKLFDKLDLPSSSTITSSSIKKTSKNPQAKKQAEDVLGKRVIFQSHDSEELPAEGIIIAHRYPIAFVYFPASQSKLIPLELNADNSKLRVLRSSSKIRPTEDWKGQIVDCLGNPLTTEPTSVMNKNEEGRDIFAPIPQVSEIALVNRPLLTGVTAVDALAPIGRGQNMLIVGEEGTGRRNIAISAIRSQIALGERGAKCVYACTTPIEESQGKAVVEKFKSFGVMDDVTFVSMRSPSSIEEEDVEHDQAIRAAEAIVVAASACSIAEYWARTNGHDTFVVVDTVDQHKLFWDFTTKILVDVYGLDAVAKEDSNGGASSEMRGFFSNLIQRAGRYNAQQGGGSVTLAILVTIPPESKCAISETTFGPDDFEGFNPKIQARVAALTKQGHKITPDTLNKLQIPVPHTRASVEERKRMYSLRHVDDLISMTDGQIWLSQSLLEENVRPPMDPRQSITRIGIGADTDSRADAPALRNLIGGLRFEFAQASALEGANDAAAQKQLLRRDALLLAMYQDDKNPVRTLSEECICLLAARMGCLDDAVKAAHGSGTSEGKQLVEKLISFVKLNNSIIVREIDDTFDLDEAGKAGLESSIRAFFS